MARSITEMAQLLRKTCERAEVGDKVTAIHLFGIAYGDELRDFKIKELNAISEQAGQSPKYGTELRKMVRLSKFVKVKRKFLTLKED